MNASFPASMFFERWRRRKISWFIVFTWKSSSALFIIPKSIGYLIFKIAEHWANYYLGVSPCFNHSIVGYNMKNKCNLAISHTICLKRYAKIKLFEKKFNVASASESACGMKIFFFQKSFILAFEVIMKIAVQFTYVQIILKHFIFLHWFSIFINCPVTIVLYVKHYAVTAKYKNHP